MWTQLHIEAVLLYYNIKQSEITFMVPASSFTMENFLLILLTSNPKIKSMKTWKWEIKDTVVWHYPQYVSELDPWSINGTNASFSLDNRWLWMSVKSSKQFMIALLGNVKACCCFLFSLRVWSQQTCYWSKPAHYPDAETFTVTAAQSSEIYKTYIIL